MSEAPRQVHPDRWIAEAVVTDVDDGEITLVSTGYHCEMLLPCDGQRVHILFNDSQRSDECQWDDCEDCHDDDDEEEEDDLE